MASQFDHPSLHRLEFCRRFGWHERHLFLSDHVASRDSLSGPGPRSEKLMSGKDETGPDTTRSRHNDTIGILGAYTVPNDASVSIEPATVGS